MSNAYAKGQEESLREVVNAIKLAPLEAAVMILYEFGTAAYGNGVNAGVRVQQERNRPRYSEELGE